MQTSSYPADAIAFARHRADQPPLDLAEYPTPRPLGPTPRLIRAQVGERELGRFGSVLNLPPIADTLPDTVARARAARRQATRIITAEPAMRLISMRDAAARRADKLAGMAMMAASAVLVLWFGVPVALSLAAGAL